MSSGLDFSICWPEGKRSLFKRLESFSRAMRKPSLHFLRCFGTHECLALMVSPDKLVLFQWLQRRFSTSSTQWPQGENQPLPSQHTERPSWVTSELISYVNLWISGLGTNDAGIQYHRETAVRKRFSSIKRERHFKNCGVCISERL